MRSNLVRMAALCLLMLTSGGLAWGSDTARDPWAFRTTPGDLTDLCEQEARRLCTEVQRVGWTKITLEQALAAAPSLKADLRKAADAGLLHGSLAVALQDNMECSEPPVEVVSEGLRYIDRFGWSG